MAIDVSTLPCIPWTCSYLCCLCHGGRQAAYDQRCSWVQLSYDGASPLVVTIPHTSLHPTSPNTVATLRIGLSVVSFNLSCKPTCDWLHMLLCLRLKHIVPGAGICLTIIPRKHRSDHYEPDPLPSNTAIFQHWANVWSCTDLLHRTQKQVLCYADVELASK